MFHYTALSTFRRKLKVSSYQPSVLLKILLFSERNPSLQQKQQCCGSWSVIISIQSESRIMWPLAEFRSSGPVDTQERSSHGAPQGVSRAEFERGLLDCAVSLTVNHWGPEQRCLMVHWSLSVTPGLPVMATNTDNVTLDRMEVEAANTRSQDPSDSEDERRLQINSMISQTLLNPGLLRPAPFPLLCSVLMAR